jgi:HSP20 family protein
MFLIPITRTSSRNGQRDFGRHFDRLFDETFHRLASAPVAEVPQGAQARLPALDVAESAKAYTARLDMPGVDKQDVKIAIVGNRVSVEAQVRVDEAPKAGDVIADRVIHRERPATNWSRTFALPTEVDQAESSAKLDNGVLTLTLTKRSASSGAQLTVN